MLGHVDRIIANFPKTQRQTMQVEILHEYTRLAVRIKLSEKWLYSTKFN